MRKRHLALAAVVLLLALIAWVAKRTDHSQSSPVPVPMANGLPPQEQMPLVSPVNETPPTRSTPSPTATAVSSLDEEAMREIDRVSLMVRDYRTLAGENPVGTNAEIMAAVMGDNAKQAQLGPPEGMKLNEKGELIDRWGTPYFFHQISRDHMEIRSAGPDKVLWTADDAVLK